MKHRVVRIIDPFSPLIKVVHNETGYWHARLDKRVIDWLDTNVDKRKYRIRLQYVPDDTEASKMSPWKIALYYSNATKYMRRAMPTIKIIFRNPADETIFHLAWE